MNKRVSESIFDFIETNTRAQHYYFNAYDGVFKLPECSYCGNSIIGSSIDIDQAYCNRCTCQF